MIKRNVKLMTTLVLALSLSIGVVTASAATPAEESNSTQKTEQRIGNHNQRAGSIYSILKNNLGFTNEEIESARNSGKTAFDLAKEKGKTPDELKTMIIEAKSKGIDESVTKGKITKEKAVTIKTNLKTKMQNWDGSLKHKDQGKKAE
jgi:hypothetical protein